VARRWCRLNRDDRRLCPAPTRLGQIIGDSQNDVLERNRFAVYALVSALLVPDAALIFQQMLRKERNRKEQHARFVKQQNQRRRRELKHCSSERTLERVLEAADKALYPDRPEATVAHIAGGTHTPPCWTGDPRPEGRVTVPLPGSNVLTADHAAYLVRELGYDANAAFTSITRRPLQKSDRGKVGELPRSERERSRIYRRSDIVQPIPIVAAPIRRTTQGYVTKDTVLRALAEMRCSHPMRMACLEVVFQRQSPTLVAEKYDLGVEAVNKSSSRLRARIQGKWRHNDLVQKPNVYAGSEADVSTLCA